MVDDPSDARHPIVSLRRVSITGLAVVLIIAATGIGQLRFNSHYSVYFNQDDPDLTEHNAISKTFSRQDGVFVVLASTEGNLLTEDSYVALEELTSALATLPHATSATSAINLDIVGDVETADGALIPTLEELREHDRAVGLLLSADAHLVGILVEFRLPFKDAATVLSAVQKVRDTVAHQICPSRILMPPLANSNDEVPGLPGTPQPGPVS